jgi:hypothetical protein
MTIHDATAATTAAGYPATMPRVRQFLGDGRTYWPLVVRIFG